MENISLAKDIGDIVTQNAILEGNLAKSYLAKEMGDIVTQNEINEIKAEIKLSIISFMY